MPTNWILTPSFVSMLNILFGCCLNVEPSLLVELFHHLCLLFAARLNIEEKTKQYVKHANKGRREMVFTQKVHQFLA